LYAEEANDYFDDGLVKGEQRGDGEGEADYNDPAVVEGKAFYEHLAEIAQNW